MSKSTKSKSVAYNMRSSHINQDDLFLVSDAELDAKGLANHHIASANDFYEHGIKQILTQVFKIEKDIKNYRDSEPEDKLIDYINVKINFTDVKIHKPTMIGYHSGNEEILFPNKALEKKRTYSAVVKVDAVIKATAYLKNGSVKEKPDEYIKDFKLCKIPIMVKSRMCNLHGLSKEALINLNEDPSDPGGYFIIIGIERVLDSTENILFNQIRIFKNTGHQKEINRVEFVSKPGVTYQNSDYLIIRLLNDNQLTCEIVRDRFKEIKIPFYLLFRLLGWTDDKTIIDNIIYGYEDEQSINMLNYIKEFMSAKYTILGGAENEHNPDNIMKMIIEQIKEKNKYLDLDNKDIYHKIYNDLYKVLDVNFLPHIGITSKYRFKKLRYLALIIRKILLVKMGVIEPTDRDSYKSKRLHAAGTSFAKSFKTYLNASIIQPIKKRIEKDFKAMPFSQVNLKILFQSTVYGEDFEKAIIQTITAGNKTQITVNKKQRTNNLSSQLLDRKNQIAVYSTLRQVTATSSDSSKQSERAHEMRRVHTSFLGYICVIQSPDGEKVGINKQLAISATIVGSTSSEVIKNILLEDPDIIELDKLTPNMIYNKPHNYILSNVYVNGDWIGCTKNSLKLSKKYRKIRRQFKINPLTTIYWDNTQDEVYFWVDAGRVARPLIIVYNNKRNPEKFKTKFNGKNFKQEIAINSEIIDKLKKKEIGIDYLLKNNMIEYITAEEQENCYIAHEYNKLLKDENNILHEYTHCDIPQNILGLAALTSPYANHNQTPRITFQTSQCKQTCGRFTLNWPHRCDKDTFLQYICETPLVKTISNKYIFPNGCNAVVAIMCYSGYNQEDSLVISKGAIDRGMFRGCKFTFYEDSLEQHEKFGNPDITNTSDIKSGNYSKLSNGIIKKGMKISKGDAIIGKYIKKSKPENNLTTTDRSTIYKDTEDAIVHRVIVDNNEEGEKFCRVGIRKVRDVVIGDKFCLTDDHDVLTEVGWKNITKLSLNDSIATLSNEDVIEYRNPIELPIFDYDGLMYKHDSDKINIVSTMNHKMYVKRYNNSYNLESAQNVYGNEVFYKKSFISRNNDIRTFVLPEYKHKHTYEEKYFDMNVWLKFLTIYLSYGIVDKYDYVRFKIKPEYKKILTESCDYLGYNLEKHNTYLIIKDFQLKTYLETYGGINDRIFPVYMQHMSSRQCSIVTDILLQIDNKIYVKSINLANGLQIIGMNAGYASTIYQENDLYIIHMNKDIEYTEPFNELKHESLIEFSGKVYCVTVPNHVFMIRRRGVCLWTGNSSRAGQKGVTGILLRDSDMPFTKDGLKPSIIMNPHAIPSRMTIGQMYESTTGNWCAKKGTHADSTIFTKTDIESMANELEELGLNRHGYHRLYSGITGEYIDCLIFMGPTYYQRLQKFVIDKVYSVSQGPSAVLSRQPLDGKSSGGGIRMGEMERDVSCSHGSMRFLQEKFSNHSDGFREYICRCGKSAIVNTNRDIYKCKHCGDNADITVVNTTWSAKLFTQEMESMGVGIRRRPSPFTYEVKK